jgi:hypothetical protein
MASGAVCMRKAGWMALAALVLPAGCADKRPVLYPNARLKQAGAEAAQRDPSSSHACPPVTMELCCGFDSV